MALPTEPISEEIIRAMQAAMIRDLPQAVRFADFINKPWSYKPVTEYHFPHCGCDFCGVYRMAGIA